MRALLTRFIFGNGTWFQSVSRSRREAESIFSRYYSRAEIKERGGAKRAENWVEVGSALIGDYSGRDRKWTTGRY